MVYGDVVKSIASAYVEKLVLSFRAKKWEILP
jgi:hypothetical protein